MSGANLTQITDGDTPLASVVMSNFNAINDKFNTGLDNTDIATNASIAFSKIGATALTTFAPAATGFSALTSDTGRYIQLGKIVFAYINVVGTSNATTLTFTLPVSAKAADTLVQFRSIDNGTSGTGRLDLAAASSTATAIKDTAANAWTNSGTKAFIGMFTYEAN